MIQTHNCTPVPFSLSDFEYISPLNLKRSTWEHRSVSTSPQRRISFPLQDSPEKSPLKVTVPNEEGLNNKRRRMLSFGASTLTSSLSLELPLAVLTSPPPALPPALPRVPSTPKTPLICFPQPDFDDCDFGRTARKVPLGPKKEIELCEMGKRFLNIYKSLEGGTFIYRGVQHTCEKVEGAKGTFMQAYRVTSDIPLIEGYSNDEILIKAFHEVRIREAYEDLENYMRNSLAQYQRILNLGLSVAEIFNFDPNDLDKPITDGFYIVNQVPYKAPSIMSEIQWQQLKEMFNRAVQANESLDLVSENCHCDKNGILYLIDFVEESNELTYYSNFIRGLRSWSRGSRERFEYLSSDFEKWDATLAGRCRTILDKGSLYL